MSKVLFLSIPSHGHMNPTLGLAQALVNQGEKITFFSSDEYRNAIEEIGAEFKAYKSDLNIFQKQPGSAQNTTPVKKNGPGLVSALLQPAKFIDDLLMQIPGLKFDYLVYSAAYPYAQVIAQILQIPAISSFAVFATLKDLTNKHNGPKETSGKGNGSRNKDSNPSDKANSPLNKDSAPMGLNPQIMDDFKKVRLQIIEKYHVEMAEDIFSHFFNKGDLNIIYTSKYFIPAIEQYDESYIFIGPPIYNKQYHVAFPFERLEGKKIIYISLGTIFSNHSADLNQLFFTSFGNTDALIVMAAYNVDLSKFDIPKNFIVRNYVPQSAILKYTDVAITHAGMNSISDLVNSNIPFVAIPLGADQPALAQRAEELGATISLDVNYLNHDVLRSAVEKVLNDPSYLENMKKISVSFKEAGGYKKAVEEIFKLKKEKGIIN